MTAFGLLPVSWTPDKVFDGTGECISAALGRPAMCIFDPMSMPAALAALDLPRAHVIASPRRLPAMVGCLVALERRYCCAEMPEDFAGTCSRKTRPTLGPCLTLSCVFRFGDGHERAGEFVGS